MTQKRKVKAAGRRLPAAFDGTSITYISGFLMQTSKIILHEFLLSRCFFDNLYGTAHVD